MNKSKFYGIVTTSKKEIVTVMDKNNKAKRETVSCMIDVVVTSEFNDRRSALLDIKDQAAKLGTLKFFGAFQ